MAESQPTGAGAGGSSSSGRPSVCRNCGAIIGAGEAACYVCGAPAGATPPQPPPQAQQTSAPRYDAESLRFARAVLSRPATFTFVFLAANVFVFALMYLSGGAEDTAVFRAYGAKFNTLIDAGEWWRFVTPVFIHVNGIHLLVNMYSLFMLGPYVERLYGSARFVFFWIVTGVAGVAASYFASRMDVRPGVIGRFLFRGGDASAGASGALFGLIGVLFVFGIKFRHELPEGFKRAFGFGMLPTILINLAIGYTLPFIDNAAHMGGFVAGAALALFVGYKRPGQKASVAFAWHALQILSLALVVVCFGEVARHFAGPAPGLQRRDDRRAAAAGYVGAVNGGQAAFAAAINEGDVEAADKALAALERAPHLSRESDALRDDLKQLLARARDYAPVNRKERQTREEIALGKQLLEDMDAWNARFKTWIGAEGKDYNLMVREPSAPPATPEQEGAGPQRQQQDGGGRGRSESPSPPSRPPGE